VWWVLFLVLEGIGDGNESPSVCSWRVDSIFSIRAPNRVCLLFLLCGKVFIVVVTLKSYDG
jgi:hypothetical protein